MKCIDEIKKIGIDKVSAKTRITQDKLQDIVNFRYDAFNKTHARGFIQIIEREFNIDLSEWFDAFNEFHTATLQVEESNEISEEINKSINIPIESTKKDKSYIVLIALFVVVVLFFIGFFVYNNFIKSPIAQSPAIEVQESDIKRDIYVHTTDTQSQEISQIDEQNADSNIDETKNSQSIEADSNDTKIIEENNNEEAMINDEIAITPNEPLWVGIIDIKSRKKQQFSISSKHSFTLDSDKIIRTGHSYFAINASNFNRQFLGGNNKYLLYKVDGGIKEISHEEFLNLNGGEEW